MQERGPAVVEAVSMGEANVAEQERAGRGTENAGDPVLWEDAQDSLPGADPEAGGPVRPALLDKEMETSRSSCSPTVSASGPSLLSPGVSSVAGAEERGSLEEKRQEAPDGFFYVSVSNGRPQEEIGSVPSESVERSEAGRPSRDISEEVPSKETTVYTGPNSQMQMYPRDLGRQLEDAQQSTSTSSEEVPLRIHTEPAQEFAEAGEVRQGEGLELARVKSFCASILKTLAPPLLSEFERTTGLRADAEPFTPKRVTRRSVAAKAGTQVKMASAAESSLLKALGFCPENLSVSDDDLRRFKEFFDSPIREAHLRVLAAIFGKELPASFERESHCVRVLPVQ
jgi:hypothetical protein